MKLLEEKIVKEGRLIGDDILKVDSFLNHRCDVMFYEEMANEWYHLFENEGVNKILTIEASGIGISCVTALKFRCPVVFAKKSKTANMAGDMYSTKVFSFTHKTEYTVITSKSYLGPEDRVLIIDDFLANGEAMNGLIDLCDQAGAKVVGLGAVIEKEFQGGGNKLREQGYRVESLAKIASMSEQDGIKFC